MSDSTELPDLIIVYDGKCIFCENYVAFQKLRKNIGTVRLLNARENPEIVSELAGLNMDINQGMAAKYKSKWYYGAKCMTLLSNLSDDSEFLGIIWKWLFINPTITALLYPIFRSFRNLTLKVRGVKKIPSNSNK